MKTLKAKIVALGFKPLSKSVYACRHGDLVHTVMIYKDRYGLDVISVLVSIPSFFEVDSAMSLETLQSPLAGEVSPRGVVSTYSWDKDTMDGDLVVKVVSGFLGRFATPSDVRNALADRFTGSHFGERLPVDAPLTQAMLELPIAKYPVEGSASSLEGARDAARQKLKDALGGDGFKLSPEADAIAVRARGAMFDGVRALIDDFGMYITLTCFPWTTAVWQVDKRWKGSYFPMLPFEVQSDGKPVLFSVDEFVDLEKGKLREMVAPCLERAAQVRNHHQFADALGANWGQIAANLYRLPLV